MNLLLRKNLLHCTMVVNKTNNIYLRQADIKSKMEYYSGAHRVLRIITIFFIMFVVLLMIICGLSFMIRFVEWINRAIYGENTNNSSDTYKGSLLLFVKSIVESIVESILEHIPIAITYIFLLRQIILFALCTLYLISLYRLIKQENINKKPIIIDITENIINILISIFWMWLWFQIYFSILNEEDAEILGSFLANLEVSILLSICYIICLIVRWLIGKIFNKVYDLFQIKLETEPSDTITVNQ